jgi:hypothetical protein
VKDRLRPLPSEPAERNDRDEVVANALQSQYLQVQGDKSRPNFRQSPTCGKIDRRAVPSLIAQIDRRICRAQQRGATFGCSHDGEGRKPKNNARGHVA